MALVVDVKFEHYRPPNILGVQEATPRLSWGIQDDEFAFKQTGYEAELTAYKPGLCVSGVTTSKFASTNSRLVPWPFDSPLRSRQQISVRIRVWDDQGYQSPWSDPSRLEVGLLNRSDWTCERIAAPWGPGTEKPDPEQLFRKEFALNSHPVKARLYITAQGVYEAEVNGSRVGDYFLAPGWTSYNGRIQYQTYDVTPLLLRGDNCIGVRVAEGWFSGRLGFEGGHRNIWGPHTALFAQIEFTYDDGQEFIVVTDDSWKVIRGPIRLAEIYDGEKYDATLEVPRWSSTRIDQENEVIPWDSVLKLSAFPESTHLVAGFGEPVRRLETVKPVTAITTPKGKTILDFGQNLVGYVRLSGIRGARGHKITISHAEVMENSELGVRPLRICKATDEYILKGSESSESYEPRFTFHGFRYAQIDGWPGDLNLASVEAVVCHTDMTPTGSFSCSDPLLNQLYQNVIWGMRGNFLSVPTDCPQRDERLGWSGDLALFAPTACLIYDCFGMLKNWLVDLEYDQQVLDGVPPMVSPNATLPDPIWCRRVPCAIWHDVTILAPWALYQETGDTGILSQQYNSMMMWMKVLPRNKSAGSHLWDPTPFQLGDWLDPTAPQDQPWKGATDAKMVSNMFLIQSLDLMAQISDILGKEAEQKSFTAESQLVRAEFQAEYVTVNGRLVSDSQAAYALAICLNILTPSQRVRAGTRLVELVRKNQFKVGTGFAATPFLCEALAVTGNIQVAYAMLLEKKCPSWLYPVTMGATTVWERWDSMLPDGSINPGEMTSFNHYAFGAIAKFLYERLAGLQRLEPGWSKFRIAPSIGAEFSSASAHHVAPQGTIFVSWKTQVLDGNQEEIRLEVMIPPNTRGEVILPEGRGQKIQELGPGQWSFQSAFTRDYEWPLNPLPSKS
ncbi:bacterial alpha-L-rhamnosidase-domain-containing protein [Dactylonectria macrodidyma]|uniref:alpha-L-rhamnosidase n=1 Tax=Dactylonectria macrodidyma TaxID=307937 RepID=A0A9P9J3A4_9HYPO|nr:bacterial alpha-L-rhamnosidase-domain-containing protein [Dactylonectria macrodidyma]